MEETLDEGWGSRGRGRKEDEEEKGSTGRRSWMKDWSKEERWRSRKKRHRWGGVR